MKKIRVGIVASGMMGRTHADALRRVPGAEVVAITSPSTPNLEKIAEELGIPHTFRDYKEMCDQMELDVLHNCTPNSVHYEINKYAIERGIALFCEKPLAATVEEAESLCRLLEEKPVPNGVNFNYRSNAMVREMRARIRNGEAGRPLLVHGGYLQDWLMYETDYNWRLEPEKGGASRAMADIGSHWFDTAQVIMDQRITEVYAKLLTVYPERLKPQQEVKTFAKAEGEVTYQPVKVDSEDAGLILVKFEDGTFGSIVVSEVSGGYKNGLHISVDCANYSMRWDQEEADHLVIGDRIHGVMKQYAASGSMTADAGWYATLPGGHAMGWADALHNNIRLFYDSIKKETWKDAKQEYSTFADATYIMKLVDACLKSNEEEKWVKVCCHRL